VSKQQCTSKQRTDDHPHSHHLSITLSHLLVQYRHFSRCLWIDRSLIAVTLTTTTHSEITTTTVLLPDCLSTLQG